MVLLHFFSFYLYAYFSWRRFFDHHLYLRFNVNRECEAGYAERSDPWDAATAEVVFVTHMECI